MTEEWVQLQAEEIEALNSIFDPKQWKRDENDSRRTYILTVDHRPERAISLEVTFVDGYPIDVPMVYNIRGPWLRGEERKQLTAVLEDVYMYVYSVSLFGMNVFDRDNIGKPIVFLWADALRDFVDRTSDKHENDTSQISELIDTQSVSTVDKSSSEKEIVVPPIYSDESFEDRKSVFQAHLSPVHSKEEVHLVLNKLKENKKIANATHNIYAYRIWDDKRNIIMADCDDDGETAASSRMLHLMDVNSRWDELKIFYQ
ncbi:unnamed protein product [Adineta ricciae]|uniref:RWD domain-containing protein n=1 Tax=Adineta ricciae TaxID=249248 RepID=A0A815CHE6_ADIRI|nr:unnamed protein product [Adineta ricciae]